MATIEDARLATPPPPPVPQKAVRQTLRAWYADRRGRGAVEVTVLFVLLQLGCVIFSAQFPKSFAYLDKANIGVMSQSIPWLAMLAIGSGIVMMAGELDLSIAMSMGMCELVFVTWYSHGHSAWLSAGAAIVLGALIALINAIIINVTKIASFIATLGMASFWWGAQQWYVGQDKPAPRIPSEKVSKPLETVFRASLWHGLRGQMIWLIAVTAIVAVVVHRHRLGNHILAVGGNENAARSISINPNRVRIVAFLMLGLLVGLAAVLKGVQEKTLIPGSGVGYELEAITAAVIGGTALRGGKGSVIGAVLGVGFLKTFQAISLLTQLDAFYYKVYVGLMVIIFAIINQFFERRAK
jgi:simple sugar transport system permease protein